MAADVVQDNIILVAYANSGAQAAVVINRYEWGHKQAGDDPDAPARWYMLDNRVIQVQRMPRTRLGTCSNESQPCHEWPLLASETSLWDLSRWTMDAMIDRVMDQPIFANFWLANRAKQRHNYVAQIVKQPRCAISEKPMYCDLCEPNGTTWDNLQSMLSLLLMSTSGLPLPMGYQWQLPIGHDW